MAPNMGTYVTEKVGARQGRAMQEMRKKRGVQSSLSSPSSALFLATSLLAVFFFKNTCCCSFYVIKNHLRRESESVFFQSNQPF